MQSLCVLRWASLMWQIGIRALLRNVIYMTRPTLQVHLLGVLTNHAQLAVINKTLGISVCHNLRQCGLSSIKTLFISSCVQVYGSWALLQPPVPTPVKFETSAWYRVKLGQIEIINLNLRLMRLLRSKLRFKCHIYLAKLTFSISIISI